MGVPSPASNVPGSLRARRRSFRRRWGRRAFSFVRRSVNSGQSEHKRLHGIQEAADPDSEIVTNTTVTAGNIADGAAALDLLAEELAGADDDAAAQAPCDTTDGDGDAESRLEVYGDSSYGAGSVLSALADAEAIVMCKVQTPNAVGGRYTKDAFTIDLQTGAVSCPAGHTAAFGAIHKDGEREARFTTCSDCPLRAACTTSPTGRTIKIKPHEALLAAARQRQTAPGWKTAYNATRPTVERKISHLMTRRHGGRRARMRGTAKIAADFKLLAGAINLERLAVLGLTATTTGGWAIQTA